MKQTVRNNTFETNSSSMHSLVYSKREGRRYAKHLDLEDGILTIHFRDYGWSGPDGVGDLLARANDKLDYVMSSLCCYLAFDQNDNDISIDPEDQEAIKNLVYKEERAAKLLDKIKERCKDIKDIKFELDADTSFIFGHIDHQSQDLLYGESTANLIKIIFNKNCMIVIDNDNSCYYTSFNKSLKPGTNACSTFSMSSVYNITDDDFEE